MSKIKELDRLTIQKIAAGEVIERPASIVKELVENSIDAGAKQIVVEISDAGRDFIRVTDDGEGMDERDLELAFKSHATSKLHAVEDLEKILTMGFRGEALSSICSVSRVEVTTRSREADSGIFGIVDQGVVKDISPAGSPTGTTMIIRKLFYNLPVRKRFLKSKTAEENAITETVTRLAMGNPEVSLKYIKDSRVVFNTTGLGDVRNTVFQLLGKDLASGLMKISISTEDFGMDGYISNTSLYRSSRHHQYLYVNGRYVVDYRLSKIIEKQYSSMIPTNRYPVFVLFVSVNPSDVDVNIHPTKQEIKFTNDNNIYQKFEAAIRNNINELMTVPKSDQTKKLKKEKEVFPSIWDLGMGEAIPSDNIDEKSIVFIDYSSVEIEEKPAFESREDEGDYVPDPVDKPVETQTVFEFTSLRPLGTAFKTYIITEEPFAQKLYIIDQHAAHERVMYEKLLKEYREESVHIQQLLEPIVMELPQTDHSKAMENIDLFQDLGFEVEEFGERSIIIRGVPLIFGNPDARNLFMEILDNLEQAPDSGYDTKIEKIIKLACTSAIKAGDSVAEIEIGALLKDLEKCSNPLTCPHGRPTIIEMTKKELEKKFLRIQ